jgi:hypothetical protein
MLDKDQRFSKEAKGKKPREERQNPGEWKNPGKLQIVMGEPKLFETKKNS